MGILLQGIFGIVVLIAACTALSEDRRAIPWKTVAAALLLQFALAAVLLKTPGARVFFLGLNAVVQVVEDATRAGTSFVFGYLGGAEPPFSGGGNGSAYILAFRGLPLILVASALSSVLFYLRVLPKVVKAFARVLQRTLGVSGAEGLVAAANVFIGMMEAPVFVRPYLPEFTRGELFSLMTCGMATIAGTVMVLYATILQTALPDALGHLLIASIISAPAAIAISRILIPCRSDDQTAVEPAPSDASSTMDALTQGTLVGVQLLVSVIAMLVVLVAMVSLANAVLGLFPHPGGAPVTLQRIFGGLFAPVAWLMGVPWSECGTAGGLMGVKTVLNEFLAYLDLAATPASALSERSRIIMTYAMCGFANPGSLGIMIGGLGAMAPDRRGEIAALGIKSVFAGTVATCMTGAVVGLLQ